MSNVPVAPEIHAARTPSAQGSPPPGRRQFDLALARPFIYKSVSEETRAAYTRAVREFFAFVGGVHPAQVTPADVIAYRDHLRTTKRRKANTVATKLAIVRSFFEYLARTAGRAAGHGADAEGGQVSALRPGQE
jgi:site-specific recombinase XerD